MFTRTKPTQLLANVLRYGVFLIIVLVPFYTFVTTWIGSNTGGLLLLRAWKELVLLILCIVASVLIFSNKELHKKIKSNTLLWAGLMFVFWTVVVTVFTFSDADANLLGITMQLRPIVFFAVALVAGSLTIVHEETLVKLVAVPAVGVAAFGILQMFALPYDFLKHVGYQKNVTIPPYFTIDEQLDRIRIMSTLRGPNPLGVYVIAPLIASLAWARRQKIFLGILYIIPALIVLYGSHSRSAWIGLAVSVFLYIFLSVSKKAKLMLLAVAAVAGILLGGLTYQLRSTIFVQDVVLHDNPSEGGEVSSNQGRIDAFRSSLVDIKQSPVWGCGAGCAGPASFHNARGAKIAENFYIQTIQELGVVGLVILLIVQAIVIGKLLSVKTRFSYMWIAVFAGVSVASLFSHAWADDTITYIWWGIAGLLLGSASAKSQPGVLEDAS